MIPLIRWALLRSGFRNTMLVLLLPVALWAFAFALAVLVRGLDGPFVLIVVLAGVAVGWLLGASPLPSYLAAPFAAIIGGQVVLFQAGQLGGPLAGLAARLVEFGAGAVRWLLRAGIPGATFPSSGPLSAAAADLLAGSTVVLTRGYKWLAAMSSGGAAFDPVAVALVWGAVVFLLWAWAGWALRRRDEPLGALLPLTLFLAAVQAYSGASALSLVLLLGVALVLTVLLGQVAREQRWKKQGMDYSDELLPDVALAGVPLCVVLTLLATLVPSVSVHDLAESAQSWVRQDSDDSAKVPFSLGLAPAPAPTTVFDSVRSPGLPNEHLIGLSPQQSNRLVLKVKTDRLPAGPDGTLAPRYYWRSQTYDRYSGRGWYTSWTEIRSLKANETALQPRGAAGHVIQQEVTDLDSPAGPVYAAGQLIAVDRDYRVALRSPDDLFGGNVQASSYRASSWVLAPTPAELQGAGTGYPDWVVNSYLQLPEEVPARVLALARDLTARGATPFDRARAIESYLRGFPYMLDVPRPPSERDVVDYFLFDLKRGYCDYYSSAMVVLARAAGLPARLVVGYSSGKYDAADSEYQVTAGDAHSWAEIYFPGYGWVEFEPTAGREEIDRSAEASRIYPPPRPPLTGDQAPGAATGRSSAVTLFLAGFFGLAALAAAALALDEWRLRSAPPAETMTRIYRRAAGHARALRAGPGAGCTPYELTSALGKRLEVLEARRTRGERSKDVAGRRDVERAGQDLRTLAHLYVLSIYSNHPPTENMREEAIRAWNRLRSRLWRLRIQAFLQAAAPWPAAGGKRKAARGHGMELHGRIGPRG